MHIHKNTLSKAALTVSACLVLSLTAAGCGTSGHVAPASLPSPTDSPTEEPTQEPTSSPTTAEPADEPTADPTQEPTEEPTVTPEPTQGVVFSYTLAPVQARAQIDGSITAVKYHFLDSQGHTVWFTGNLPLKHSNVTEEYNLNVSEVPSSAATAVALYSNAGGEICSCGINELDWQGTISKVADPQIDDIGGYALKFKADTYLLEPGDKVRLTASLNKADGSAILDVTPLVSLANIDDAVLDGLKDDADKTSSSSTPGFYTAAADGSIDKATASFKTAGKEQIANLYNPVDVCTGLAYTTVYDNLPEGVTQAKYMVIDSIGEILNITGMLNLSGQDTDKPSVSFPCNDYDACEVVTCLYNSDGSIYTVNSDAVYPTTDDGNRFTFTPCTDKLPDDTELICHLGGGRDNNGVYEINSSSKLGIYSYIQYSYGGMYPVDAFVSYGNIDTCGLFAKSFDTSGDLRKGSNLTTPGCYVPVSGSAGRTVSNNVITLGSLRSRAVSDIKIVEAQRN